MLADTDATLAAVPSWMKELSNIIGLQLDLMASMQSSQASEIEASKASIKGQPTQSESVTVDDWDRLTRRFAALQTEKIAQIGVQHKAHGESGKGSKNVSNQKGEKGFGLLGREERPCFQRPLVKDVKVQMASIKECEDPDEKDARTEEFTWETSHENLPEKHGKQNAIQDMVENYDRRIMESVIVEKESRCPSGLLNPRWVGKLAWDFGVMFFVLMDAIVLPFQLTFKSNMDNDQMDTFDITWLWTTTLLFATDIILTFNTAVESAEQDGHFGNRRALNLDRCHIAKLYLRGWFVIDFGSTVPWAQISEAFYSGDSSQLTRLTKVVKFVRLLRLVRMLRLAKLRSIWERMEIRIGSVYIIQCISLLRVLSVVVAMCHWSACLFWLVGLPKNLFTELMSDEEQLAYEAGPHWTTVWRRHSNELNSEPWRWLDRSISETYVFCFYWTLGVMRTMPAEVTPVNLPERVFVLIFMFFALSAFAISIALITQSFFKLSERKKTFNEEFVALRLHLQKSRVSEDVQGRVKAYLTHLFDRRRIQAKEANLLNILPEGLREEIFRCQASHHMQSLSIVQTFRRSQRLQLAAAAATCDLMPGQPVVQRGDVIEAAWILMTGQLHKDGCDDDEYPLVVHAECLENEDCDYSDCKVVATEMSEVLKVDKAEFLRIAKAFQGSKQHVDPVLAERKPQLKRSISAISSDDRSREERDDLQRATVAVMSTA